MKKRIRKLSAARAAAAALVVTQGALWFAGNAQAAGTGTQDAHPPRAAAGFRVAALSALVPNGTALDQERLFTRGGTRYALMTTQASAGHPFPWLIVARQEKNGAWEPLLLHQAAEAWRTLSIVVGPQNGTVTAVAVQFVVDAATGVLSNIDTVLVSPSQASVANALPDVIAAQPIRSGQHDIEINALNLQVIEGFKDGRWTVTSTPLTRLLESADIPVGFVLGTVLVHGRAADQVSLLGSPVIHARAGDTLSFVPLNHLAQASLSGAIANLGRPSGISVYTNGGGVQSVALDAASQVLKNEYRLSSPGTVLFDIVPPRFPGTTANSQVAQVKVIVDK